MKFTQKVLWISTHSSTIVSKNVEVNCWFTQVSFKCVTFAIWKNYLIINKEPIYREPRFVLSSFPINERISFSFLCTILYDRNRKIIWLKWEGLILYNLLCLGNFVFQKRSFSEQCRSKPKLSKSAKFPPPP